jgi:uncharacterized protein with HEPN domain
VTAPRDYRHFLGDIVKDCRSIIYFTEGMSLDDYLDDEKTRFAVMRGYEILGEAVRHIPEALKSANADIPWRTMAAVRNRIVHGYFGVNDTILFTTIGEDLKPCCRASRRWHGHMAYRCSGERVTLTRQRHL